MGRPRGFDEKSVVQAAAALFAGRPYGWLSVDDLVAQLGVHRNSLYKTFGSKRGLYLMALRQHVEDAILPLLQEIGSASGVEQALARALGTGPDTSALDVVLLAAVESAPSDPEVAAIVADVLARLDKALERVRRAEGRGAQDRATEDLTAILIGRRLRVRAMSAPPP